MTASAVPYVQRFAVCQMKVLCRLLGREADGQGVGCAIADFRKFATDAGFNALQVVLVFH